MLCSDFSSEVVRDNIEQRQTTDLCDRCSQQKLYLLLQNNPTAAPAPYTTASAVCTLTALLHSLVKRDLDLNQITWLNEALICCRNVVNQLAKVSEGMFINSTITQKCWHCTFLQTTDVLNASEPKYVSYISYQPRIMLAETPNSTWLTLWNDWFGFGNTAAWLEW